MGARLAIEQILDHPFLNPRVPLDGINGVLLDAFGKSASAKHMSPSGDGVQRSPQLMGGGGEELMLEAARLFGFA